MPPAMLIATLQTNPFPPALRFVDVDPAELADETSRPLLPHAVRLGADAWDSYRSRLRPPVRADSPRDGAAPLPGARNSCDGG